jgi:hypothetical protein
MIISVQSVTNMEFRLVPFAANRMSDRPIDERLLTMTEPHRSRRDDHSLDSGRPAEKDQSR